MLSEEPRSSDTIDVAYTRGCRFHGEELGLEDPFFDIVLIEKELHFARRMAELRDIGFKIFLHLF